MLSGVMLSGVMLSGIAPRIWSYLSYCCKSASISNTKELELGKTEMLTIASLNLIDLFFFF
jgi:hypothetical protein